MIVYLDLETIPVQRSDVIEGIKADARARTDAKAETIRRQYKKPETIEKHLQDLESGFDVSVKDVVSRTALDGGFGQIICIGWAVNDRPVESLIRRMDESEADLIGQFFSQLPPTTNTAIQWVGHAISTFDLRFLWQRCLVLGIAPPVTLPVNDRAGLVTDTMTEWGGWGNRDRWPSLDKLCRILDIPSPKDGMNGSQVWDYAKQGRFDEIAEYCRSDVTAVREVYRRMFLDGCRVES